MAKSTAAQILGAYRRELDAEGFPPDEIRTLVIEASRTIHRDSEIPLASRRHAKSWCPKSDAVHETGECCKRREEE